MRRFVETGLPHAREAVSAESSRQQNKSQIDRERALQDVDDAELFRDPPAIGDREYEYPEQCA